MKVYFITTQAMENVILDSFFDDFCTIGNRSEYSTKLTQIFLLQLYYVSTLPGKTKNTAKTADRLLQCVLLNRLFNVRFFPCLLENSFTVF